LTEDQVAAPLATLGTVLTTLDSVDTDLAAAE
jgi:hypothetical protein